MVRGRRDRWREALILVAGVAFGTSVLRGLVGPDAPTMSGDAAFFQHAGWYVTTGATPYVHIWDIKPPLTIEVTAGLAWLSLGNMAVLHGLSVLLTVAAGIGAVYLVGHLVHRATGDDLAGFAAGLGMLTLAGFHYLGAIGFRPKYFAIVFGLLAIALQLRERPVASGAAAAASAGFIQPAAVFPALVLGMTLVDRRPRRYVAKTLAGMAGVTAVVVAPILLAGGGEAMITEVVLVPVLASASRGLFGPILAVGQGIIVLGYATIPVLLGVYGLLRGGLVAPRERWWLLAGGAAFGGLILFVDFEGYPDLFFGLAFASMGIGLLVAGVDRRTGQGITAVVAVVVAISVVGLGGFGVVSHPVGGSPNGTLVYTGMVEANPFVSTDDAGGRPNTTVWRIAAELPNSDAAMQDLYWSKRRPASCHYRYSLKEIRWLELTNRSYTAETCGQFPDR